jgi:hypothetical protein
MNGGLIWAFRFRSNAGRSASASRSARTLRRSACRAMSSPCWSARERRPPGNSSRVGVGFKRASRGCRRCSRSAWRPGGRGGLGRVSRRITDNPKVKSVVFEDSTALLGLLLAFGGADCISSPAPRRGPGLRAHHRLGQLRDQRRGDLPRRWSPSSPPLTIVMVAELSACPAPVAPPQVGCPRYGGKLTSKSAECALLFRQARSSRSESARAEEWLTHWTGCSHDAVRQQRSPT